MRWWIGEGGLEREKTLDREGRLDVNVTQAFAVLGDIYWYIRAMYVCRCWIESTWVVSVGAWAALCIVVTWG